MRFLIILLLTCGLNDLNACTCIGLETTAAGSLQQAATVVKGKVITMTEFDYVDTFDLAMTGFKLSSNTAEFYIRKYKAYTIAVEESFKMPGKQDTITIITGYGDGDCGYVFEEGKEYIIYATVWVDKSIEVTVKNKTKRRKLVKTISDKVFETNICTRTQQSSDTELNTLRELKIE